MSPVRLVHISDIHITAHRFRWRREDWLNKRLASWINVRFLGRGRRFRLAETIVKSLQAEWSQTPPDCVVFSGDATAMGLDEEFERAGDLLGLRQSAPLPGIAVPGNHDYCTRRAASGPFERHFARWQQGQRIEEAPYPFASRVGSVWLIGVCSAIPNRWPWDASGRIGAAQLERLRILLRQLEGGPRILVTHYPLCLASGKREGLAHRLRDSLAAARVAADGGVSLWLHGHRHDTYHLQRTRWTPFPIICSGSTTQHGLWSHGEYQIIERKLHGVRRVFDPKTGQFRASSTFELDLPA